MTTIATLFSGGEGVGVGARMAGVKHLWGIEIDDKIANVARRNGFNVITDDICLANPADYARPDILHMSPVCTNASVAKANGSESALDIACAQACARFIDTLQPAYVTLENVYGYRLFESFAIIRMALERNGYFYDMAHINAADYGVPQSRRRLILRASKGLLPGWPPAQRHVGWLEAIADLVEDCPVTDFAPWQYKIPALVEAMGNAQALYVDGTTMFNFSGGSLIIKHQTPAGTITKNVAQHPTRMFIPDNMAFVADGKGASDIYTGYTICNGNEPIHTLTKNTCTRQAVRMFVPSYCNAGNAIMVGGENSSRGDSLIAEAGNPAFTLTKSTGNKAPLRALVDGTIRRMTTACLARLQSFPDSYVGITPEIIGNSVPPLLYRAVLESLGVTQ